MSPEDRVVARLFAVFGEPKTTNPALFLEEFAKAIKSYSAEVLERATDEVIRDCTFWPKPKEIVDRATAIATSIARRNKPAAKPEPLPPPLTPEQKAEADRIMAEFYANIKAKEITEQGAVNWHRGQRPQFEQMQAESPNTHLHGLTERSRAMTGERD